MGLVASNPPICFILTLQRVQDQYSLVFYYGYWQLGLQPQYFEEIRLDIAAILFNELLGHECAS